MKKVIKLIAISQIIILATYFISFSFYMNVQVAFLSSLFIIVGSSFAYKKLVNTQVSSDMVDKVNDEVREGALGQEKRDFLDEIEDPHELYDDEPINNAPVEELDLKAIVKEERKKIKTLSGASMKKGLKGGASLFRLVPYLFLVLGFIALKNNDLLDISIYLPSLLFGIIIGSISSKEIFS